MVWCPDTHGLSNLSTRISIEIVDLYPIDYAFGTHMGSPTHLVYE